MNAYLITFTLYLLIKSSLDLHFCSKSNIEFDLFIVDFALPLSLLLKLCLDCKLISYLECTLYDCK
jgi:hypothetical protein